MKSGFLQALFLPFETGALPLPPAGTRVLFINGEICAGTGALRGAHLVVQQYFRPYVDELCQAGYDVVPEIPDEEAFDMVLLSAPRQRAECLHAMAAGLGALKPGGVFLAAAANDAGGKRLARDARRLGLDAQEESKHRARVIWGIKHTQGDYGEAFAAGDYQPACGGQYISRPGIFCWDRIDTGSALLASALPDDGFAGRVADFGCGYGYLVLHLLTHNREISDIYCIDADARAVEACRRNVTGRSFGGKIHYRWADIGSDADMPSGLDSVVMNPPFHENKETLPEAGLSFIEEAARGLLPGGKLWMVANAHLPYEKALSRLFPDCKKLKEEKGYKVFRATKAAAP